MNDVRQQRASAELAAWRRWRVARRQRFYQQHLENQRAWSGLCRACGMALPHDERTHQFCPATTEAS